jgi:hypothetical protein
MKTKLLLGKGKVYRGEIIWELGCGLAAIYPTWLGGRLELQFSSIGEAQAFVDAALLVVRVMGSYAPVYAGGM